MSLNYLYLVGETIFINFFKAKSYAIENKSDIIVKEEGLPHIIELIKYPFDTDGSTNSLIYHYKVDGVQCADINEFLSKNKLTDCKYQIDIKINRSSSIIVTKNDKYRIEIKMHLDKNNIEDIMLLIHDCLIKYTGSIYPISYQNKTFPNILSSINEKLKKSTSSIFGLEFLFTNGGYIFKTI